MKPAAFCFSFLLLIASACAQAPWRPALPGWHYEFPRDHAPHPDFKTEWWYFTGEVRSADGQRFGYELTFFRQGVLPPAERGTTTSRFIIDDLKFAHFALSDPGGKHFHFFQKTSRGSFGEAGFGVDAKLAWIDDWTLQRDGDEGFTLRAASAGVSLALELRRTKPWALHGENGVSQKAAGKGSASHYYSGTRLATTGSLGVNGHDFAMTGESWFDHEWATNQLAQNQIGWDWFSLQLDDGSELMLYQMRLRDGGSDPNSSGTLIARDGTTQHLRREDFTLRPLDYWKSPTTKGRYPIAWELRVAGIGLTARITTPLASQELNVKPNAYWEGLIDLAGDQGGKPIRGHGYLELTGYAGSLVGLGK
jgi:predicted secreted hydrolase